RRESAAEPAHERRPPLPGIRGYAEYYRQRGGLDNGSHPAGGLAHESSSQPAHNGAAPGSAPAGSAAPPRSTGGDTGLAAGSAQPDPLTGPDMDRIKIGRASGRGKREGAQGARGRER